MIAMVLMSIASVLTLASCVALLRSGRRGRARRLSAESPPPPVTVLKPLRGADPGLEQNLRTFFEQSYDHFELLFGIECEAGVTDPAIAIVERLCREYPGVAARVVRHHGGQGLNPKVSNLRRLMEHARFDHVLVSDSGVSVSPDYLAESVAQLEDRSGRRPVGLVTHLIAGVGDHRLGATLDCLHLNGTVAAGVAGSRLIGRTFCVGKSMLFRRSILESLGGMESVATLLAEDYVIGRMFQVAGFEVRLSAATVRNVTGRTSVRGFLRRHLRWGLMRSRLTPLAYPFEILGIPLGVAALGLALDALLSPVVEGLGTWPADGASPRWIATPLIFAWALALVWARDLIGWWRLRGVDGLSRAALLAPIKDTLVLGVWLLAPLRRHVGWRGRRYRISAGTRLYAEGPSSLVGGPQIGLVGSGRSCRRMKEQQSSQ